MVNVNISIKKEAYEFLKLLKAKDKSFSDIILEFKEKNGGRENLMSFFGVLKEDDWDEREKNMADFRREFNERLESKKFKEKS